MAKTELAADQLRKGAKVVSTVDLREVPAGTSGKVIVVNGFTWIRYWVRFANGVSLGSISRDQLATPADLQAQRDGTAAGPAAAATGDPAVAAADEGDGGGVTTPNGTFIPQKFIERAAAARARLAA